MAVGTGKGKGMDQPQELPQGIQPADTLILSQEVLWGLKQNHSHKMLNTVYLLFNH